MNNLVNIFFIFYIISTNNLLSFSFINKISNINNINKIKNNFFSISKLNMTCDYYILHHLKINYKNEKSFSIIELSREEGYFYKLHKYNEDEDYYDYKVLKFYDEQLIPKKDPEIIYSNGSFIKDSYDDNYNKKINEFNKKNNIKLEDISEISKVEFRIKNY